MTRNASYIGTTKLQVDECLKNYKYWYDDDF